MRVSLQRGAATVVEKWTASYKTQHTHTARPSILLLGVCRPKELKTRPHKTCTGRIFNGKKSLQQVVLGELDSSVCISDIQAHPLPICDLPHSSWQHWILNPQGKARD